MARKKVNLQWIDNDVSRRSTFQRRSATLMKKANELATLCGVKVSVVVYKDDDDVMPLVYPSNPEARELFTSFKAFPDHLENLKKVMNMEEYLRCRISKMQEQKGRSEQEKQGDKTSRLLYEVMASHGSSLPSLTIEELLSLKRMVENRMKSAKELFQQIKEQGSLQEPLVPPRQEQPLLSSQMQAPNTYTEMETLDHVEEPQPQQQDSLAEGLSWTEGDELSPMVYGNIGTNNGDAGPSNSKDDITMKDYNMDGDFEFLGSWDNFLDDMD